MAVSAVDTDIQESRRRCLSSMYRCPFVQSRKPLPRGAGLLPGYDGSHLHIVVSSTVTSFPVPDLPLRCLWRKWYRCFQPCTCVACFTSPPRRPPRKGVFPKHSIRSTERPPHWANRSTPMQTRLEKEKQWHEDYFARHQNSAQFPPPFSTAI